MARSGLESHTQIDLMDKVIVCRTTARAANHKGKCQRSTLMYTRETAHGTGAKMLQDRCSLQQGAGTLMYLLRLGKVKKRFHQDLSEQIGGGLI